MKFKFSAFKLSLVIVSVFILQNIFSGFTDIFVLNERAYYEVWRFVTAAFLHADVVHLISNLFALLLFGSILESFIGARRFYLIFFLSGVFANLISVVFYPSSLGASGAIFGILGCLVIIRPLMVVWAFGMPMPMFVAGLLWATGDIIGIFVPSNVGNIAHLSGMFLGLVFGLFYRRLVVSVRKREERIRIDEHSVRQWENYYLR